MTFGFEGKKLLHFDRCTSTMSSSSWPREIMAAFSNIFYSDLFLFDKLLHFVDIFYSQLGSKGHMQMISSFKHAKVFGIKNVFISKIIFKNRHKLMSIIVVLMMWYLDLYLYIIKPKQNSQIKQKRIMKLLLNVKC